MQLRGRLEPDERAGEDRAVRLPPAALAGLPGDLEQLLELGVADPVEREHVADVARAGPGLAGLETGDLRGRAVQLLGDLRRW